MSKNPVGRPSGYKMTDESKLLIGAASKGRVPVNRAAVSIEGITYESIKVAAKAHNIPEQTLRHRLLSQSERFKEWIYA